MKLAFYKAWQSKATLLDKVVAIFTMGKYSHVEIVFRDGISFSISPRDNGSRYKKIDYSKDNAWDIFCTGISIEQENGIRQIIDKNYLNKEYDFIGAIFSSFPFCIQKENKIFCSEVTVDLMSWIPSFFYLKKGCLYSPNTIHRVLKKRRKSFKKSKIT